MLSRTPRSRSALQVLESPLRAHGRPSLSAPDPDPLRRRAPARAPAPALARAPRLFVQYIKSRFQSGPDSRNSGRLREIQNSKNTPGSGVRGRNELVLTTDSDRARP
eukprot:4314204-Pleurochrysis_carterae.AAC.1